ncbi:GNAT family N-acetyltransferase [Spirulina sp. CS-785/01]|uniref:GNAT family N-acetyltransferase n=1 Tax=Spirulina sp. CS-785/01 TaxID=3021716 RepID=UPI00232EB515|nr:GNAT family N-acetyltransferase [Spirulina sp. CS-785/01]MDB9311725.1 GNAT family N-acetyltransferase [Spirulina sp. CS-785/01]
MIRDATETDLSAIVSIYNAAIPGRQATADTHPISVESRWDWFRDHTPNRHPLWVNEKEGEIIGWLSLQAFYGRPAYAATAEVSLYIHPKHQGKGIGKTLLRHALQQSPSLGLNTLLAFIFAHNQPSLQLFNRFDFTEWGYLPRIAELDKIERDLMILGKRLRF